MQKEVAIDILQDIYNSLQGYDWKENRIENFKNLSKEFRNSN